MVEIDFIRRPAFSISTNDSNPEAGHLDAERGFAPSFADQSGDGILSTKIFNGFKLKTADLAEIHAYIMEWRSELKTLHTAALARVQADIAIELFDKAAISPGTHAGVSPLIHAYGQVMDRQQEIKKSGRRDPAIDFEFGISLMPYDGAVYGMVFSEQHKWVSLWMEKAFVEDFCYWNNTDAPDDINEHTWDARGEVWDAILDFAISTAPSMAGFTADCTHPNTWADGEDVLRSVPAFEIRVDRMARSIVMAEDYQRRHIPGETPPSEFGAMISTWREVEQWMKTVDGQARLEVEKTRVASLLKPIVTSDDFLSPIPESVTKAKVDTAT